jgi:nucleotide-binding universal stress UspA family protein
MYRKILVPLDGSESAEEILPHVERLAFQFHSAVTLMQVMEIRTGAEGVELLPMGGGAVGMAVMAAEENQRLTEAYLNKIKARLQTKGIVATVRTAFGSVVDKVLSVARQENVDLIAMASRGRAGAACVISRCVTARFLQHSDRPLLIIRHQHTS